MDRPLQFFVATCLTSLLSATAWAQTEKPCLIMFENLSHETFNVRDVSVLQSDGSRQEHAGFWTYKPGVRSYLVIDETPVEGRQVFYTIELPDGTKAGMKSTSTAPLVLDDQDFILQMWEDGDFVDMRKDDADRSLTKGEATYRYWNTVHAIQLDETFDAVQDVGFLEFSKITGYVRSIANRIDDLETEGVDDDAVAAAKAYSALLREMVKVMNGQGEARAIVTIGELYNLKVDSLTKMLDENQKIVGGAEDLFQFMRSRRKALQKRYDIQFPRLIPPVSLGLAPYLLTNGYYVNLQNSSGEDLRNVQIRYRDVEGRVSYQTVANRLVFNPAASVFDQTQIDPGSVGWRVERGEWITITYEGGAYSYPTSKLIKR